MSSQELKCELCANTDGVNVYEVDSNLNLLMCEVCRSQIDSSDELDEAHWHCLNESMWSENIAVQIICYRLFKRLKREDMLDMLYLEDEILEIANSSSNNEPTEPTKDSNNNILKSGDSVTIIKDLEVKGAGFTAKRGTVVRNITLTSNPEQIEGRVNKVRIVLLSKFLKKI